MKTTTIKRLLSSIAALALAMIGASASANSTWNYDLVGHCPPLEGQGTYVAICDNQVSPALALTMSGWSTAPNTAADATFKAAKIYDYGYTYGLGVVATNLSAESSTATGPHAIDNALGTDAILLSFGQAVALDSLKIGWNGTDNPGTYDPGTGATAESSDISVLRYTGTAPPTPVMLGTSLSNLLTSGWQLVGNYGQVGRSGADNPTKPDNTALISSTVASSWWLISAYNPSYTIGYNASSPTTGTTPVSSSGYALTIGNDYFKLLSVAGTVGAPAQTPEPGSIALAGLGMIGLLALRRRQNPV